MVFNWVKNTFVKSAGKQAAHSEYTPKPFKVVVVEFADNVESNSGESIASFLNKKEALNVTYYNELFNKSFLNLENKTLFDLIDKGQDILDKTGSDVLIWGYREGARIRLNFQSDRQYETEGFSFLSLMDSIYIPAYFIEPGYPFPESIGNIIYGAVISARKSPDRESKIQKKYLLKKIIDILSKENSSKILSVEYMPYIMNFLGIIYLSFSFDNSDDKDFKIVKNLFETAIKHQDLITNPIHLGCIYNHLGQLYDCAADHMSKKNSAYFKGAITYYRNAQKYLSKYNYPYDYGYISNKLSDLFFNFWKKTEDIQALRDSVFQLREAEKIYTYALFPEFWSSIQGKLGHLLSILGKLTNSSEISDLAIASYKNQQKIITERRDPLSWAKIQEKIGEIYYTMGKRDLDKDLLEEALEYFHDALYIFENMHLDNEVKVLTTNINKTSQNLHAIN
ncbi:MAG: hypothetical protein LBL47_00585 [Lactobacillus sp.]|jgi:hypothetical protein|nr:hypothetical protein [Lactobacillus sp.]